MAMIILVYLQLLQMNFFHYTRSWNVVSTNQLEGVRFELTIRNDIE